MKYLNGHKADWMIWGFEGFFLGCIDFDFLPLWENLMLKKKIPKMDNKAHFMLSYWLITKLEGKENVKSRALESQNINIFQFWWIH